MSVKIRLARGGAKKRPYYRIVVTDSRMPRDGRFIEAIGHYNPMLPKDHENRVALDTEKAAEWIRKGAKPTDRVVRFLSESGVYGWTAGDNPKKAEPGEKAKERAAERAEKGDARKAAQAESAAEAEVSQALTEKVPVEAGKTSE